MSFLVLIFIYLFIYLFNLFFWLCRVLVAARRVFVVALGLLSSCGVGFFLSLVVVRGFQSAWAL